MRSFEGAWCHPSFSTQNDKPFDENDFTYDNIKVNKYLYYQVSKYECKSRARPILKVKLKEPNIEMLPLQHHSGRK